MKNLMFLIAIVLVGVGAAMMFTDMLPFEASMPKWADKASMGAGVVLGLAAMMGMKKS
ncbi:hypothetical protein [Caulobacter sp. 17J80-11]|uniref:hypothetical protein n=1 Tax=Caulobacter sp. 17J80-11 TaxID=2763502 RepID=UPI001653D5EB|nr:hypothetical protein [Caulobacter sp. 17J80-11]MBC6982776.1 hypothetical protein [Caulobacter sp. 17J80-11]